MKNTALAVLLTAFSSLNAAAGQPNLRLCGRYSVWLNRDQDKLGPFNHYFIRDYEVDQTSPGNERMIFKLPPDLTGGQTGKIVMKVVATEGKNRELAGAKGGARCKGPWNQMTCNFRFRDLNLDHAKTAAFLTAAYGATEKRDALLEIAARFGNDPIGVGVTAPRELGCH